MRHPSKRNAPTTGKSWGALNTKQQNQNIATLGTHCFCTQIAQCSATSLRATCANHNRLQREIQLRRSFGYVGFYL